MRLLGFSVMRASSSSFSHGSATADFGGGIMINQGEMNMTDVTFNKHQVGRPSAILAAALPARAAIICHALQHAVYPWSLQYRAVVSCNCCRTCCTPWHLCIPYTSVQLHYAMCPKHVCWLPQAGQCGACIFAGNSTLRLLRVHMSNGTSAGPCGGAVHMQAGALSMQHTTILGFKVGVSVIL